MRIEEADGVTPIVVNAGGGGKMVNDAGALLMPEADALICIAPADTPVATLLLRIAIALLPSDAHVNVMPFIKLLNWSYPTAV
jgi:hypothetical protein